MRFNEHHLPKMPSSADSHSIRMIGRLHSEEAAKILGFQPFDIPVLVRCKLLKPLGSPEQNAVKYFSAADIISAAQNHEWLDKATKAIAKHWKFKNEKRKTSKIHRNTDSRSNPSS